MSGRALWLTFAAALAAIALPAVILPLAGPAKAARVVFLEEPNPADLPQGVTVDRWNGRQAVLAGVDASAARALYAQGAVLVYPVRSTGCLTLSAK
jgi:hypothetical protein